MALAAEPDDDLDAALLSADDAEEETDMEEETDAETTVPLLEEGMAVELLVAVEAQLTDEGRFVTPAVLQRFRAYVVAAC